nr:phage capsid protein [Oscillospiraceae bacterium]
KKTNGLFTNLTKTTANTATKQFERALDRAYMQISSGAIDPATAVKGALKSLAKQGVGSIEYPSGHIDSIEVAVRRATITGVNQTAMKMQEARADELGVDLVETTAHAGARPSHAEWQGKIFSRSGKSSKYPDFVQVTGYGSGPGLGGWNCSHSFSPYFEGAPRTYSNDLLKEYAKEKYTYNGQTMTEYDAIQQQRSIERNLRRWKRENVAMKAAGLDTTESAAKIAKWQGVQKDFIDQTGLKRQAERESIAGWGRSQAASARADAKKYEKALAEKQRYDTMVAELKKAGGLPKTAKVNIPPKPISVADLSFDDVHINKERGHDVTRAQAEKWIQSARVSVTVWNGRYERYLSSAGAAYVDTQQKAIRTAFPAEQYDDNIKAIMGVLDNNEKAW